MSRWFGALALTIFAASVCGPLQADDDGQGKDARAQAVLDRAIEALGGAENLKKAEAATWKTKATVTVNGGDNEIEIHATVQGLDHYRAKIQGVFAGNGFEGVVVINGDRGWRQFGEKVEMDENSLAHEKRRIYLQVVPSCILPVRSKGFQVEAAGEEKVDDKPATVLKITGPDGKDFRLFFDKESGLPVKLAARVVGFQGEEYDQESTFKEYKDFGGIKKATRIDSTHDGDAFVKSEITEFRVLEKVDEKEFAEPED